MAQEHGRPKTVHSLRLSAQPDFRLAFYNLIRKWRKTLNGCSEPKSWDEKQEEIKGTQMKKSYMLSAAVLCVGISLSAIASLASAETQEGDSARIEDVGGAFIYSNDAKALADWYTEKLGIELKPNGEGGYWIKFPHGVESTAFAIKPAKAELPPEKTQFMVNFRVTDFGSFVKRLNANGIKLDRDEDIAGFGHFGEFKDKDLNRIEFWEHYR